MQKTAQRRGILNRLRENTNLSGMAAEKFFTPEFQQLMDQLRDGTDDPVRAILSGTQIGQASPPDDAVGIKDLLKETKSAINRREYMKAVANLGRFHKKMFDAVKILSQFKGNVDSIHEKFLFEGLDDDSKKHLHDLKGRITASNNQSYFIKEANIMDFFANIGTERGRALAAWEKRYPKQVGKLKNDTNSILKRSEALMTNVLSVLKDMATARATRNVDKYLLGADKIVKLYNAYDVAFKEYYNANVKGFLEKQKLIADSPVADPISPAVPAEGPDSVRSGDFGGRGDFAPTPGSEPPSAGSPKSDTLPSGPVAVEPVNEEDAPDTDRTGPPEFKSDRMLQQLIKQHNLPAPSISPSVKPSIAPGYVGPAKDTSPPSMAPATVKPSAGPTSPPSNRPTFHGNPSIPGPGRMPTIPGVGNPSLRPTAPVPAVSIPSGRNPTLIPNDEFGAPEEAPRRDVRVAHQAFYKTLESLGQTESPAVLSMYIKKYATVIQHKDLVTSLKLFELAKNIKV